MSITTRIGINSSLVAGISPSVSFQCICFLFDSLVMVEREAAGALVLSETEPDLCLLLPSAVPSL